MRNEIFINFVNNINLLSSYLIEASFLYTEKH
jgi:hypothetical protein